VLNTQKLKQSKALKIGFKILAISTAFIALAANLYIPFHYAAVMPRSPQPQTGRIYAIPAQYGGTVYVNRVELDRRNFVATYFFPVFGVVMVLYFSVGTSIGWWEIRSKWIK
jgi:hypothetical protein